jgi:GNAT superfamily N-acetyltransferase
MRLSASAGWNQLEEDWRALSGGFVAERDGLVVGTVGIVRHGGLSWIAMMLVDPAERGAGIGRALMERALEELRGDACVGLDATPMGHPLYLSCGLADDYQLVRTKIRVEGFPAGRARVMRSEDLPVVLARDREIFGADRGALLRMLYARSPEMAWVLDAAATGYCFGRPGRLFHQLGPVCGETREAAQVVTASCLAGMAGRTVAIDAPQFDGQWLAWLQDAGFVGERPFTRMFLRGHRDPGDRARQFAIAGPEFA